MKMFWHLTGVLAWTCAAAHAQQQPSPAEPEVAQSIRAQSPAPANDRDWIDPYTGHRIVRLSAEGGSTTLYFHNNSYTPEGDKLIFNTPSGLAAVEVAKIGLPDQQLEIVTQGGGANMARRSREVYITNGADRGGDRGRGGPTTPPQEPPAAGPGTQPRGGRGSGPVYAVDIDTKQRRLVPNATGTIINCDETISFQRGPNIEDPSGNTPRPATRPYISQMQRMFPGKKLEDLTPEQQYSVQKEERLARGTLSPGPASFIFTNLKSGERLTTGYQFANPDHQQFNPHVPNLLLFAHEGTWHEVDRTWTIRTDGTDMRLIHKRTMDMEINGHEWWSWDGKTVWFDLQTPRSEDFWIAGVNIDTMQETRYHITRDTWGVHFNSAHDDTLFSSDGGDPSQVSYSANGMWINLFQVQPNGTLKHERLADMSKHHYVTGQGGVEPNASLTPDKKWVIFTGQFSGERSARHVYAVSTDKVK